MNRTTAHDGDLYASGYSVCGGGIFSRYSKLIDVVGCATCALPLSVNETRNSDSANDVVLVFTFVFAFSLLPLHFSGTDARTRVSGCRRTASEHPSERTFTLC